MNYYGQKIMTGSVVMTGSQVTYHTFGAPYQKLWGTIEFFSNFHLEFFTNIKSERHLCRIQIILQHSDSSDRLSDRQKNQQT